MEKTKQCFSCGRVLPSEAFKGNSYVCRECHNKKLQRKESLVKCHKCKVKKVLELFHPEQLKAEKPLCMECERKEYIKSQINLEVIVPATPPQFREKHEPYFPKAMYHQPIIKDEPNPKQWHRCKCGVILLGDEELCRKCERLNNG